MWVGIEVISTFFVTLAIIPVNACGLFDGYLFLAAAIPKCNFIISSYKRRKERDQEKASKVFICAVQSRIYSKNRKFMRGAGESEREREFWANVV